MTDIEPFNYINLLKSFADKQVSAVRARNDFMAAFKSETILFPDEIYTILNDLFCYFDEIDPLLLAPSASENSLLQSFQVRIEKDLDLLVSAFRAPSTR